VRPLIARAAARTTASADSLAIIGARTGSMATSHGVARQCAAQPIAAPIPAPSARAQARRSLIRESPAGKKDTDEPEGHRGESRDEALVAHGCSRAPRLRQCPPILMDGSIRSAGGRCARMDGGTRPAESSERSASDGGRTISSRRRTTVVRLTMRHGLVIDFIRAFCEDRELDRHRWRTGAAGVMGPSSTSDDCAAEITFTSGLTRRSRPLVRHHSKVR
jgi:hypothetical protein